MKILQVLPYFPYTRYVKDEHIQSYHVGGVERHAWELCNNLARIGYDVTVVTSLPKGGSISQKWSQLRIFRLPSVAHIFATPVSPSLFPFLLRLIRGEQFDLIHTHIPPCFYAEIVAIASQITKIPLILTYHNDIYKNNFFGRILASSYNATALNFLLHVASRIIATSKSYAMKSPFLHDYLQKVVIIHPAIEVSRFSPTLFSSDIRGKFSLPREKIILYVGYLDHHKGLRTLVKALPEVLRKCPSAHLLMVGKGPLRNELQQLVHEMRLNTKVSFLGYISDEDLPRIYASSDLFVFPPISRIEGFGIVQLEALASGLPVIATDIPGVRELSEISAAVTKVKPADEKELSRAIIKIINELEDMKDAAKKNRKLVEENYSWDRYLEEVVRVYKSVSEEECG